MLVFCVAFLGAAALATGQITSNGKCQNVTTQQNFNMTKYVGLWYEIKKYPTIFLSNGECITVEYTPLQNGSIQVKNSMCFRGHNVTVRGIANESNQTAMDGKLKMTFPTLNIYNEDSWVLATDYSNYSVVWSCFNGNNNTNRQYAWILSRTHSLTKENRHEIHRILMKNKLDIDSFQVVNQTHCCKKKRNSAPVLSINVLLLLTTMLIKSIF